LRKEKRGQTKSLNGQRWTEKFGELGEETEWQKLGGFTVPSEVGEEKKNRTLSKGGEVTKSRV